MTGGEVRGEGVGEEKIFSPKNATPLNKYLDSRFWNPSFLPEGEVVGEDDFTQKKCQTLTPYFYPGFSIPFCLLRRGPLAKYIKEFTEKLKKSVDNNHFG